jgi:hypothetical protein
LAVAVVVNECVVCMRRTGRQVLIATLECLVGVVKMYPRLICLFFTIMATVVSPVVTQQAKGWKLLRDLMGRFLCFVYHDPYQH